LLCFSHNISSIVGVLCNYGGNIIDIDNDIIYHGENIKFCSLRLDSSFIELKVLICKGIGWNLSKINVDVTWMMLGGGHLNCYVVVPIIGDISFNAMIGLVIINDL